MEEKILYTYKGGILHYNELLTSKWISQTYAVSEKQASNNIAFQYRKKHGLTNAFHVKLAGRPVPFQPASHR